jgi:hypothetical protein
MAYVDHRCTGCTHLRGAHYTTGTGKGACGQTHACACNGYVPGEPEVVRTYGWKGRLLDTYTPPGRTVAPGVVAHDCQECQALYDSSPRRVRREPQGHAAAHSPAP